jgi:uncharacterized protein YjiS (DUF1127 family)
VQIAAVLSAAMQALRAASQRRRDLAVLAQLDSHALRDIGICRSEFGSFDAESRRDAQLTRRRVAGVQPLRSF